ncbi:MULTISPECIES: serine hydrolase [Asticcacaulis]|uniref:serine hydrolase domain-containing protein n=1 Tax=Asticcacaulis TaxID=76890 RepID=UPI001AE773E6|nr:MULTISPECIES: serine hydrolase [Asticcacaulis]
MKWRRLTAGPTGFHGEKARFTFLARALAGAGLATVLAFAGPAAPQDGRPLPELKPFVPQAQPAAQQPAPAAPPPAAAAPAPSSPATSSASASATSAAPRRPRPARAATTATSSAAPAPTVTTTAPRPPVQAGTQPAPQNAPPVAPQPAPQPTGAPATFPTVNGAPGVAAPPPTALPASTTLAPLAHDASTPISAEDVETFTDSVVRALMQRDHVMGVTVAVVQGNTPILVKGYGYDRTSPARRVDAANSLFRLGSITKTFTWVVARQELEAGRIKMDEPIGTYVTADVYSDRKKYKPLTLRALMSHTSGFEDTSLGHLFELNPARLKGPDSYFRQHKPRRVREPGLFSSYSNFGPALAARALTQTAQAKDVPSLMEARVFQPLGMDHTTLREPYALPASNVEDLPPPMPAGLTQGLSQGYLWDGATFEPQPFEHAAPLSGALGASSTAKDMARFMSLMLGNGQYEGVQLFNADSARAFHTPLLKMPEGYNGWASGLMIREAPSGHTTIGHAGSTLWFNSNMVLVPELNIGIFISTNTQTGAPLADSYPNLLIEHLAGVQGHAPLTPTPEQAYAANKAYYNAIKGQYVSTRRAYGGLEGAITRLINTVEVDVDADGRLILTTRNGLSAFVPSTARGFFNPQDSEDPGPASQTGGLHFLFDAQGKTVKAFETATNMSRYERVDVFHSPEVVHAMTVIMVLTCLAVFASLMIRPGRNERPTEWQARATIISLGLAALWLLSIFVFRQWLEGLSDDATSLFSDWPAAPVKVAAWVALLAAIGTVFQAATFVFVYAEGRYGDDWPLWRKYLHGALVFYWLLFVIVIAMWGGLAAWSR